MKSIRPAQRPAFLTTLVALALSCEAKPPAPATQVPPPAPIRAADAGPGADAAAEARRPDAGGVDADPPGAGHWIDTKLYRFRLEELVGCAMATAGPRDGGADRSHATAWLGARVRIAATEQPIYATPRDVSLKRGGLILEPQYIDQPALPRCGPLLPQKQLDGKQEARGFVLFRIPPSFQAARGPVALVYHPTRWGGARGIEVSVPECLGDCPVERVEATPARTRKTRRR